MRAGDRVGVAVSGGADSVGLLRIVLELRAELGIVVSVAHFNHGLRGEASQADEAFVAELARQHDLEFFSGCGDVRDHALTSKLSVEAAARELRYQWFGLLATCKGLNAIATGHTLDDQAETVSLKFLRGAGTRGLAGIYPEIAIEAKDSNRSGARIIRPLLEVTRDEVEQYLTSLGQTWREDESNLDHHFARNRVRHELLPLLEREYNPNLRQVLSDLAELSRAEEEYWQSLVEGELEARERMESGEILRRLEPEAAEKARKRSLPSAEADSVSKTNALDAGLKARSTRPLLFPTRREAESLQSSAAAKHCLSLVNFQALPLALQRRLLRRFGETADLTLDFEHVEKLMHCAIGELPKVELPGGWMASRTCGRLELHLPQPVHSSSDYQYTLPVPGEVADIAAIGVTLRALVVREEFAHASTETDGLLSPELIGTEVTVRNWHPGDRFHPVHSKSDEKLKRLFAEQHIPAAQRPNWPVVLEGEQIVWVRGFPVARAFAWSGNGDAVKIELL